MNDTEKLLLTVSLTFIISVLSGIGITLIKFFFFDRKKEIKAQKLHEEKMKLEDQKLKKLDEEIAETKKQTQRISEQKEKIKEEAEF